MDKCSKHPKYKGKGKPRDLCIECLNIWLKTGRSLRKPLPPSTKIIDKNHYKRRKKNEKSDD